MQIYANHLGWVAKVHRELGAMCLATWSPVQHAYQKLHLTISGRRGITLQCFNCGGALNYYIPSFCTGILTN